MLSCMGAELNIYHRPACMYSLPLLPSIGLYHYHYTSLVIYHGLLGTAHMFICKHAGFHAPKTTTHPHKQQKKESFFLLFVGVGGCFRGMAACMLANTHVGCPQEPMDELILFLKQF